MDTVIASVYGHMLRHHNCSVDDILETPELRNTYLSEVRRLLAADLPEQMLLHRLTILRKKSKLLRRSDLGRTQPTLFTQDTPHEVV